MSQSGDSGSLKISSYEGKQLASQDELSAVTRPDLSGPALPKLVHTPGEAVLANLPVTSSPSPKLEAGLKSPEAAGTILRIPRVPRTGGSLLSPVETQTVSPSPKIRVRQDLMNHLGLVASTKPSPVSASPSLTVTSTPSALDSLHLGLASLQHVQAAADPEPRSPAPCDSSADSTSLCPSLKILQSDVTVCLTRMTISQDSCRETTWPLLWITFPFTPRPHPSSKPVWTLAPPLNETVAVKEEQSQEMIGVVYKTVRAVDQDGAENDNRRVSYFLKVNNENVAETREFRIDQNTGELKTRVRLDREEVDHYELVIVARDHGTPVAFETLRFLSIVVEDIDDNSPRFPADSTVIRFTVPEEEKP